MRDKEYEVNYIVFIDSDPPAPTPYGKHVACVTTWDREYAMVFAEALAAQKRIDVMYVPLVKGKKAKFTPDDKVRGEHE